MARSWTPRAQDGLLDQVARRLPIAINRDAAADELTGREHEVLTMIAGGKTNVEIATALHLAEATVKTHVSSMLQKLQLRDRVQAVIYAYENGIIDCGSKSKQPP